MARLNIFWLITCAIFFGRSVVQCIGESTALAEKLTDSVYDKWKRPNSSGGPVDVHTRIFVYFIGSIEAQNLQFTAQILIKYRWRDERLRHDGPVLEGEESLRQQLWTPHLYLVNEHESRIMGSGKEDVLVSVTPDGTVLYSSRLKVSLLCLMDLTKFPFDNQYCPLELESWSYNTSQLNLHWEKDTPILVDSKVQMTEYALVGLSTNESSNVYSGLTPHVDTDIINSKFSGNYSCLTVKFHLQRQVGHYIMDYYVPSILLVVVSWVSFWLDPNAVPGRTTLGTSTMLTFITLSRNIGSSLPKVSYVKATEYWFIMCTGFIFGSLVEFAFVNTIWRRRKNVEIKKKNTRHILKSTLTPQLRRRELPGFDRSQSCSSLNVDNARGVQKSSSQTTLSVESICQIPFPTKPATEAPEPEKKGWLTMTPQEIANWIDKRSRLGFPILFIICNIFYWTVLLL
ncbi:ion channel [Nesidiocoris tenuis]|uniref:Ion channel n=1 Tax=Nesidiocoris tenuis TaxID=355587 RepID=A0ABN7AFM4_9HEMI|nr:ion channel [Nesidiocoris tenuis]